MEQELKGKVIVVTGAGRGIGAATAEVCAREGGKVVISDIRQDWLDNTAQKLRGMGYDIAAQIGDVSKEEDVEGLVKLAVEKYGKLDGIVNNAATIVVKRVADLTKEEWDHVIDVNVDGVFYGCKHAVRQFLAQGSGGSIVNIGSISAVVGMPDQAVYCASKGAVFQLTRNIAVDYAPDAIRCNTIGPGSVDAEFLQIYLDGQRNPDTARERTIANHPINRLATVYEIAEPICFLLSDRASFITGANLQVDGGYSTK